MSVDFGGGGGIRGFMLCVCVAVMSLRVVGFICHGARRYYYTQLGPYVTSGDLNRHRLHRVRGVRGRTYSSASLMF